jgi:hypothetical protein
LNDLGSLFLHLFIALEISRLYGEDERGNLPG